MQKEMTIDLVILHFFPNDRCLTNTKLTSKQFVFGKRKIISNPIHI